MPKTLDIKQPSMWQSSYQISDAGALVGGLDYAGLFRSRVSASMVDGSWRFVKHSGLAGGEVAVLPNDPKSDSAEPLATYRWPALRQTGTVTWQGRELTFKVATFRSRYSWLDKDGSELAVYKMDGFLKRRGNVEVSDALLQLPSYQMLIPLGLYLGMEVESANSAAAGAAASTAVVASS
jgi:hypothetical protein